MAHDEPVDATLDLDALLRQELAVEPSVDLLPRVRQQIAASPARSWRWTWIAPMTAAATLALAAVVPSDVQAPQAPAAPIVAIEGLGPQSFARPHEAPVPDTGHRIPESRQQNAEVIVDQRQRDALLSFMRILNEGQLPGDAFKHTTSAPVDVAEDVFDIFPVPVAVSPILVGGVLSFDLGRN